MSPHRNPRRNQGEVTPDDALRHLIDGNKRYLTEGVHAALFAAGHIALVEEHAPIAAILGCADARVGAEVIFDQSPGDLFMVRLAGNFLSDYGLASMEYAVDVLGVPLLMVLGHSNCGAVTSAVNVVQNGLNVPGRVFVLMDALEPSVLRAREQHPEDLIDLTARVNVQRQAQRLRTISPLIAEAIAGGDTRVVGAMYHMETGEVEIIDS